MPSLRGPPALVSRLFAHEPFLNLEKITPATTFSELETDSLDYMNSLVEAEEKLGIRISDTEAERFVTVGQFLRHLRLHDADWPTDYDIRLVKKGGCFSRFRWIKIGQNDLSSPEPETR
jgi:acyl carrier protein